MNPHRVRVRLGMAAVLGGALAPALGIAQKRAMPSIGVLSFFAPPSAGHPDPGAAGMLEGLRELGYQEGRNIRIERRYAENRPDRLAGLAAELVGLKVDVIVAGGPPPREAASRATRTIAIVTVSGSDPVREGWAQSLAHPGGNVTGLTITLPELDAKRLELLKQAFATVERVAVLLDPDEVLDAKEVVREMHASTRRLGLELSIFDVRGASDLEPAFARARDHKVQAVYALATNTLFQNAQRIAVLAARARLPSVSELSAMTHAGFVMSYGADLEDLARRAMTLVDKVLKGERPGDLPIQRPTKFQLTVNVAAARAAGVVLPQSILLRADEVIG